ncbi:hypothetical protein MLD38_033491 [Melastoma candidum]|uniref:Uncharacterized protein n=1 Tax=Melastoma candidum TaxID=119954 RepID=A0ACB9M729_9MYRT|nr:hypothetical protein MLD38_033491 [Melastoma candidum]
MERPRSKRTYYYDSYDSPENPPNRNSKPRYNGNTPGFRRHGGGGGGGSGSGSGGGYHQRHQQQQQDPSLTTSYRILCHDAKAGGVIGKSGSIIKSIRQQTGAWINVHELVPGDSERIIEITDTRRRDHDGRMPSFSPAQEALLMIYERILESEPFGNGSYSGGDYTDDGRVITRLVVSKMHVGSLLGKGGKIIEQMRMETKTQIRILPRDHTLPHCISVTEEIVQVIGDAHAVKSALSIISSRLRESQHRDRSHFHGRIHSPERGFPPDDNFLPRRSSNDGMQYGSKHSMPHGRNNNYMPRSSGFSGEPDTALGDHLHPFDGEEFVFRILCPTGKVDKITGESTGIMELLRNEVGVDVKLCSPVVGSEEQVIVVSSDEGPDDELFPAQEALLHIQTRILDLFPDKENIVTTRLVIQSSDVVCLDGKDSPLSEIKKLTGANVEILPKEDLPGCVFDNDELVQIVGEITSAREALVEVTSRLRNYFFRELSERDSPPPASAPGTIGAPGAEAVYTNERTPIREGHSPTISVATNNMGGQTVALSQTSKDNGSCANETAKRSESELREDASSLSRIPVPLVTRSTLEVVLPDYAVPKLIAKSKSKLSQISELSGARVTLLEDGPDAAQKIILISGTPEQAERAQSLLQGFILSTQEDGP